MLFTLVYIKSPHSYPRKGGLLVGVRGVPERHIPSLGAMGWGGGGIWKFFRHRRRRRRRRRRPGGVRRCWSAPPWSAPPWSAPLLECAALGKRRCWSV